MELDISADTGLGASGWAFGNQTCSGTAPAFDANPRSASTNAKDRTVEERASEWDLMSANV